jgi:hypothetical protein
VPAAVGESPWLPLGPAFVAHAHNASTVAAQALHRRIERIMVSIARGAAAPVPNGGNPHAGAV